jgi:outer membrane protein assembly factor BamB
LISARILIAIVLPALLAACGGDKDNSDPPAELTAIQYDVPLQLNWALETRAAKNRASYRLRPLLIGNRVYSIDTGGTIVGIDPDKGRKLWKFDTDLAPITGLAGNGQILIATSKDGDIIAYRESDDELELVWKTRVVSEIRATPLIDNDQVFVRSVDGKLRSLAIADGSEQWVVSRRVPALSLTGNSKPLVHGELVLAGFDDGKLIAYDRASGKISWESTISVPGGRTEIERLVDVDGNFVVSDGVIYVASFQGRLAAIQAVSGDLLWSREFSTYQPIAIDDDALYLSSDNSHIWSIDRRTGTAFWKQDVLHARKITAPAIFGDNLVVADLDGYLHWFSKGDGTLLGRIRTSYTRNYVQPVTWQNSVLTLDRQGLLASVSVRQ